MKHADKSRRKTRFVISFPYDEISHLYCEQYCARGYMESQIKDQQLDLFANRTSSFCGCIRNTRRIRVLMSDSYPYKKELSVLDQHLTPT